MSWETCCSRSSRWSAPLPRITRALCTSCRGDLPPNLLLNNNDEGLMATSAITVSDEVSRSLSSLFGSESSSGGGGGALAAPAAFTALLDLTVAVLLRERTADSFAECSALRGADQAAVKQAHAALASVLLEAAKENLDTAALRGVLEDQSVSPALIDAACARYEQRLPALRRALLRSTFHFAHVLSLDWRLDYCVKSRAVESAPAPVYSVRLNTLEHGGKPGVVEFCCSWEELLDMLNKLKDAAKQLERSASAFA
eukprot:TRINITY_DN2032_c0_g1_i17.p4 TRINITY_DN2032_c0_g1~~TRINITY_DN2032_c0_g1_i17.p4  ORF type:complete len:256 (-),score=95.05 TRINITY_DN2032_c0_g1_i17:91-858(-)